MCGNFSQRRSTSNWLKVSTRLGSLFGGVLLAGCSTFGPQVVLNSHIEYNKAVEQVIQEELLPNIVRRRYYEPPQFVTVSSISSTMSTTAGVSAGAAFGDATPTTGNVGGSRGERPENAFVAVQHRSTWFYVDDRDYASKRFFNAVYDLFNMERARVNSVFEV